MSTNLPNSVYDDIAEDVQVPEQPALEEAILPEGCTARDLREIEALRSSLQQRIMYRRRVPVANDDLHESYSRITHDNSDRIQKHVLDVAPAPREAHIPNKGEPTACQELLNLRAYHNNVH
ncbi:hypothetical protein C0993_009626, partial [Termitomyces sp. T159_Od127]